MKQNSCCLIPLICLIVVCGVRFGFSQAAPVKSKTLETGHAQQDDSYNPMGGNSKYLGKDIPFLDPSNANVVWDSKTMNLYNNQLVRARFEKYLNAPEQTAKSDLEYQAIIQKILDTLRPTSASAGLPAKALDDAWKLLVAASSYREDAKLCDSIATMVYTVWQSKKQSDRLMTANANLKEELEQVQWNAKVNAEPGLISRGPGKDASDQEKQVWKDQQDWQQKQERMPLQMRMDEINQTYQVNRVKNELTKVQAKMEFQALILQLFMQRRFQHVIIGTRFYRALFDDGDTRIMDLKAIAGRLGDTDSAGLVMDVGVKGGPSSSGTKVRNKQVSGKTDSNNNGENDEDDGSANISEVSSNYNSTVGGEFNLRNLNANALISGGARGLQAANQLLTSLNQLDALANEAIRDVEESLDTFNYLLEQNELKSATERLMEAFFLGEYMPPVRVLPREKKRRVVEFSRNANMLLSTLEVRDYDKAEQLISDIQAVAKDFDSSKAVTLIQTSKAASNMHLSKAHNAAMAGKKEVLEKELKEAAEIWPSNPDLKTFSKAIFKQTDVQQLAITDFDQLLSQKNFRQIYNDKARYIVATANEPERQKKLKDVLEKMTRVEGAILRGEELQKRGDFAGAWESVERISKEFPNDTELNQRRSDYTIRAADYVKSLNTAREMEERGQFGSSLAWYLKANSLYPVGDYARDGMNKMVEKILPEATTQ